MQPSAGDKPDRMQSQEEHNPIYYAQVKTDYESPRVDAVVGSNWCTSFRDSNQA